MVGCKPKDVREEKTGARGQGSPQTEGKRVSSWWEHIEEW